MANDLNIVIGGEISGMQRAVDAAVGKLNELSQKYEQLGESFTSMGKVMSLAVTAPLLATAGLAVKAYGELEGVRAAFGRLNDPDLLANLQKSTKNTVSNLELMKSAVNADNFGLPVEKLGTLLEFARRRAKDTGQSVDYLVESLVSGIGKKSTQVLDNLGISATELNKALGGVSITAASIGQVTEAVEGIAKKSLGKMGEDVLTLQEQMLQYKAVVSNAMAGLGEAIAPMIKPLIEYMTKLTDKFNDLSPTGKRAVVIFGAIAAGIGPLLIGIGALIAALPLISAGVAGLGAAFTLLTGPIGLVVIAITAVAYAVYDNWGKIKPMIIDTINYFIKLYNESTAVRVGVEVLATSFKNTFAIVKGVLMTAWEVFKSFAKGISDLYGGVGTIIKGALTFKPELIKAGLKEVGNALVGTWVGIGKDLADGTVGIFKEVKANVEQGLENIRNGKKALITDIFTSTPAGKAEAAAVLTNDIGEVIAGVLGQNRVVELPLNFNINTDSLTTNFTKVKDKIAEGLQRTTEAYVAESYIAALTIREMNEKINEAFATIAVDSVSGAISDTFASIGEAVSAGGDVLGAIGSSLIGAFGGFLSSMGDELIKYGTLAILKGNLDTAIAVGGPAAIAAGIAAIAVGGLLKAAGSAIGTKAKGGFGGGGSTGSVGSSYSSPSSGVSSSSFSGGGTVVFEISGQSLVGILSKTQERNKRLGGNAKNVD